MISTGKLPSLGGMVRSAQRKASALTYGDEVRAGRRPSPEEWDRYVLTRYGRRRRRRIDRAAVVKLACAAAIATAVCLIFL